jgi:hypothetical protein
MLSAVLAGTILILSAYPSSLTLDEVEQKAITSLQRLRKGYVEYTVEKPSREDKKLETTKYFTWFNHDSKQIRMDRTRFVKSQGKEVRHIMCVSCERAGYSFSFQDIQNVNPNEYLVAARLAPLQPKDPVPIDPRLLGWLADSHDILWHEHMESLLQNKARRNLQMTEGDLAGEKCKIISFDLFEGSHYTIWLVPAKDYRILKIELIVKRKSEHAKVIVENKLKQFGNDWFVQESILSAFEGDDLSTLYKKEVIRVTKAEFNKPFAQDPFQFINMNLPVNTLIDIKEKSGLELYYWDGSKLVLSQPDPEPTFPRVPPSVVKETRYTYILAAILGVLALGAIVVFFRWRTRRVV